MPTQISWHESIVIEAAADAVYDVVSDLTADPTWRTEVDRMDVQGERELGTVAVEYATIFFGRFLKTVTTTRIVILDSPNTFVVETLPNADVWLRSERTVHVLGDGRSEFRYDLLTEVPVSGLVGALLGRLLQAAYKPRLSGYLSRLKGLVEAR